MTPKEKLIEALCELSKEIDNVNPLPVIQGFDCNEARKLIAISLVEYVESLPEFSRYTTLLTTCLHLNLENFLLHHKNLTR